MCYSGDCDSCDGGCNDGCDAGCDGCLLAGIIAGSILLLLLVIGGIVALALIPVYIKSGNSNSNTNPTLTGPTGRITASTFGQNQNLFAAGSSAGEIFTWDLLNGVRRAFTPVVNSPITGLRSIGNQIVSSSNDGNLRIWDANTGAEARQAINLNGNGALNAIELGPNNQIFAGSENGQISVLSGTNANPVTALAANANPVRFLGRLTNGQMVAGNPNSLRVYSVNNANNALNELRAINTPNPINNMIVTSDNSVVSSSANSNNLFVHNPNDGTLVRTITTTAPVQSITQTSDGNIVTSENNVIRTYNLATGNQVNSINTQNTITNLNAKNTEIFAGNSAGSINRFTNAIGRNINPKILAIISPAKAA